MPVVLPQKPLLVCDANVIASGTTVYQGPPGQVMSWWRKDRLDLVVCDKLVEEVNGILKHDYFRGRGWNTQTADQLCEDLTASGIVVPGTSSVDVSPDPDDNYLFACAKEAQADFIVSGDKNHVLSVHSYEGVPTISPGEYVNRYRHLHKNH